MKITAWLKEYYGLLLFWIFIAALIIYLLVSSQAPSTATTTGCFTAEQAKSHKGNNGCVDFNVGYTYESSKGNKFIDQYRDYSSGFEVYIPTGSSSSSLDLSQFNGKNVEVSGAITDYYGATEVIVTDASQIKTTN